MSIEKYDWLKDIYNQINFNNFASWHYHQWSHLVVGKKILAKEISQKIIANFKEV
jgi:hypothetical protein